MKKHFLLGLVFFGGAAMVYIYAIQALDKPDLQMPQAPEPVSYDEISDTTIEEPGIEMEESTEDMSLPVATIGDIPQTLETEVEEEQEEEFNPSIENQPVEPIDESQLLPPSQEEVAQQEFGNEPEEETESLDDEDLNPYL